MMNRSIPIFYLDWLTLIVQIFARFLLAVQFFGLITSDFKLYNLTATIIELDIN
jgi:hypothetical protein